MRCTATREYHGVERRCLRPADHKGPHQGNSSAGVVEWPNEANVEAAAIRFVKQCDCAHAAGPRYTTKTQQHEDGSCTFSVTVAALACLHCGIPWKQEG